jgi:hypothetical protein
MGCECELFWVTGSEKEYMTNGTLIGIKPKTEDQHPLVFRCEEEMAEVFGKHSICYCDYSEVRPILRPLNSITNKEKKDFHFENRRYNTANILPPIDAARNLQWHFSFSSAMITKWLLERHFDLFDLIKNGEAVAPK